MANENPTRVSEQSISGAPVHPAPVGAALVPDSSNGAVSAGSTASPAFNGASSGSALAEGCDGWPVHPEEAPQAAKPKGFGPEVQAKAARRKANRPFIITVLLLVLLIVTSLGSCVSGSLQGGAGSLSVGDKVAVIELDGVIQYDGSACSPEGFGILLDQAEQDPSVKAVVLRVNSGGGVATAGEEMTECLNGFSKPVVVSTASINASAAYEISSQADCIFAAQSSQVGSIGTAMELTDYSGLMDMLGISTETITSSDSKDSTYGYRSLTDEEREHYQKMVDETNEVFIAYVAQGRGVSEETVRDWATGMTWTGITAKEMGLIDELGTLDDACDKAAELGGCSDAYEQVEIFLETSGFSGLLGML